MTQGRGRAGFSLVELLIATAISVAIAGAILGLTAPAHAMFETAAARADIQQRVRMAVEAITKDLMMAGASGQLGGIIAPGRTFATVAPYRRGWQSPDPPGTFFDDRLSILYVPPSAPEAVLAADTASTAFVTVQPQSGCPPSTPLCGFATNQQVMIFDASGSHDEFRVAAVQDGPPALVGDGHALSTTYAGGAIVAGVVTATYWIRHDIAADVHQLMRYDGRQTDSPLVDDVVGLKFEYFGDPSPPSLVKLLHEPSGPWTSYGPPPLQVHDNCLFTVDGDTAVPRPEMRDLGEPPSLAPLSRGQLVDGPWCPDATSTVRFDADLLRVRRVRVTLRLRAAHTAANVRAPDAEVTFDVAPRNLRAYTE